MEFCCLQCWEVEASPPSYCYSSNNDWVVIASHCALLCMSARLPSTAAQRCVAEPCQAARWWSLLWACWRETCVCWRETLYQHLSKVSCFSMRYFKENINCCNRPFRFWAASFSECLVFSFLSDTENIRKKLLQCHDLPGHRFLGLLFFLRLAKLISCF